MLKQEAASRRPIEDTSRSQPVSHSADGARSDVVRPTSVPGPMGQPVTMATLPPPDTRRWVVRRKAEVIAAIRGGLLTSAEACARYRLSPEELELWQESIDRAGIPGLRVTRIQLYRDYPVKPRETERARLTNADMGRTDLCRSFGI